MLTQETERERAWREHPDDAQQLLLGSVAPSRQCGQQLCQAPIWWGFSAVNQRRTPFDIRPDGTRTGTSHWRTCKK